MAIAKISRWRPALLSVAAALVTVCIALAAAAPKAHAAATVDLRPNSKVPYLAKTCHFLEINGSRDAFNTCKQLGKAPQTLVDACDELAKVRPQIASDALAVALTALADGRTDTVLAGDLDAACALAKVYTAHTTLCKAAHDEPVDKLPDALATACAASRATLLGNASAAVRDTAPAAPSSSLPPANANVAW